MTNEGFALIAQILSGRWRPLNATLLTITAVSGYMTFRGMLLGASDGQPTLIDVGTTAVLALAITVALHAGWTAAFRLVASQERGLALGYASIVLAMFIVLMLMVSTYSNPHSPDDFPITCV